MWPTRIPLPASFAAALPLALASVLLAAAPAVIAQDAAFPSRPVRLVTGSAPGGAIDGATRMVAERLTARWGQPVVVENRAGASQIIATDTVAKSKPDGHTLLIATSTPMIQVRFIQKSIPYDPQRDFSPLTVVGVGTIALVAARNAPYNNVAEMVAHARKTGASLPYGTWGNGSGAHLIGEGLRAHTAIDLVHVPYKGEAAELTDLIGGSLAVTFLTQATAKLQADAGKVKVLAVAGPTREPTLPDVPTFKEQGVPGLEVIGWIGAFAPSGVPPALLDRIAEAFQSVLKEPEIAAKMRVLGFESAGGTPAEFTRLFKEDDARWTALAGIAKLKPE